MRYKLTTLTPTLIGNGQALSPVDYMVWKDQVNVLDQTRIFRLLARGPRLEGYLTQLRKATKLDFASWGGFAQNFSARRIPFEDPGAAAAWNNAPSESLFIPTFAADHRGPYLPASALKGALRTGLVHSRWNAGVIERVASSIENDRAPRKPAENPESASGASQMRLLAAADSDPVAASAFKVYLTRVASIDTRQSGKPQLAWKVAGRGSVPGQRIAESTPIFAEMAAPGTSFSGRYNVRKELQTAEAQRELRWRSQPQLKTIVDGANAYADAQLKLHLSYAETLGFSALRNSILRLQEQLESVRGEENSCLVCLGWGAGFTSKAAFLDTALPAYRTLLKAVPPIGRSLRDGAAFPKTRHVIFLRGEAATLPGWAKLQFAE